MSLTRRKIGVLCAVLMSDPPTAGESQPGASLRQPGTYGVQWLLSSFLEEGVCVCRGGFSALSLPLQPMADELRAKEAELVALREELREKEEKMDALKTELDKTRRELAQARIIRGPQQVGG